MTYSSYELKYCERCGGLGLRRSKSGAPYCCDCEQMLRAFLPRPATGVDTPGQLRRIVHRLKQRVLASCSDTLRTEETVHAS
jgi:hypothetical protein